MKKFVIETNRNYVEVMKKILADCDVFGNIPPEIRGFLDESKGGNKIYKCYVSGNKLHVDMKMPYRNSLASTMYLEILISENKTRINGSIDSLMSVNIFKKVFAVFISFGSVIFMIQTIRNSYPNFQPIDYGYIILALVLFLSVLPILVKDKKGKTLDDSNDPYGVQMEHWIANLFPDEYKSLEK